MSTPQTILSPEQSDSTACVLVNHPCGKLYVQALDAYGFQRELSVVEIPEGFRVSVYMHPGRRESEQVSIKTGERFMARFLEITQSYRGLLFNPTEANRPKNAGFVSLCERLHRGEAVSAKLL